MNAVNVVAAMKNDASSLKPGTTGSKMLAPGPNDHVFVYFADHGGPGILGMPTQPYLYAKDFVDAIVTISKTAAKVVVYVEACESGSIFDGVLPAGIDNVYVTTAANPSESSWGYAHHTKPKPQ